MVSPCRVTAEVGAFQRSSQVESGSTRMTSRFTIVPSRRARMPASVLSFHVRHCSVAVEVTKALHNSRGLVAPIAVAQQPFVKLAGRQPRELGLEIDRARHLLARQRLIAERDQLVGKR